MVKIEILYKEICNLYGDLANTSYLEKSLTKAKFIYTSINETPKFINNNEKIDIVIMGSMSEKSQSLAIDKLKIYKREIKSYFDSGKIFIATGNSFEIFGKYILENGKKEKCIGVLDFYSVKDLSKRHNSLFLGEFKGIKIVGNKSTFSHSITNKNYDFINTIRGVGIDNKTICNEGIKYNNFYGTYLLGPFLIINPYFTKYIFSLINTKEDIAFNEEAIDAYNYKLKELENPKTIFESKH